MRSTTLTHGSAFVIVLLETRLTQHLQIPSQCSPMIFDIGSHFFLGVVVVAAVHAWVGLFSFVNRSGSEITVTGVERQVLQQLFELFRSGALSFLLARRRAIAQNY